MRSRENKWHKATGAGQGYRYPHDEDGYAPGQQYLPDEIKGLRLYEPSDRGYEETVTNRMYWREEADEEWRSHRRKGI